MAKNSKMQSKEDEDLKAKELKKAKKAAALAAKYQKF